MTDHASVRLIARADRIARAAETALLASTLGVMILLAFAQIALRNLNGSGFDWADETLRILVLWLTMLGAVAAAREQRHVSIDALSRYLPPRVRRWTAVAMEFFTAGVCLTLAWYSWLFVADTWAAGDRVVEGYVAAWMAQIILPIAFALMGIRYTLAGVHRWLRRAPGVHPS